LRGGGFTLVHFFLEVFASVPMARPTFLGIGYPKSGTTSLHYILREHPEVVLYPSKEAQFFNSDENFSRGIHWYESQFDDPHGKPVIGEITPGYAISRSALDRIHQAYGNNIKLIVTFRFPVARSYSHYRHYVRLLRENKKFVNEDEVDMEYVRPSLCADSAAYLFNRFSRHNILVLIYERDVAGGALEHSIPRILDFLGAKKMHLDWNIRKGNAFNPEVEIVSAPRQEGRVSLAPGDIRTGSVVNSDGGVVHQYILSPFPDVSEWYEKFVLNTKTEPRRDEVKKIYTKYFQEDAERLRRILNDPLPEWDPVQAMLSEA
jgi:Sulfotransferase domain